MEIKAKIFNSNWETYKKIYKDAIKRAYRKEGIEIDEKKITLEKDCIQGKNIRAQRAPSSRHSRTISVYENEELKYIIGISNTAYDEDKRKEQKEKGEKYVYGNNNFHSNSYLCQGINKIFEYYYNEKRRYPNVKLYFYLLDIGKKSYPDNLSNNLTYRELYTLGFEILNIDSITFHDFKPLGFSPKKYKNMYAYTSFNKFANDILYISMKNSGNAPAYLQCIDSDFNIEKEKNEEEGENRNWNTTTKEYIYTFKTLGAQSYDNFLVIWTLHTLAKRENKKLKFAFLKERFNFRLHPLQGDEKFTQDFPDSITRLFEKIGIDIKYETTEEVRQQINREMQQYDTAKSKGIIRNQELFKNNMRKKGLQTKCYLCGCEVEEILEAAHLWGVAEIKKANANNINRVCKIPCMQDLIEDPLQVKKDLFDKKYALANSGDNGIWLCRNHHGLFDRKFYCFEAKDGKVLLQKEENETFMKYMKENLYQSLPKEVLTEKTKVYLQERKKETVSCS